MIVSSFEIKLKIMGFFILLIVDISLSAFLEPTIKNTLTEEENVKSLEIYLIIA